MPEKVRKILIFALCFLLLLEQSSFAQVAGELNIAGYLATLHSSIVQDRFRPLHLRYLSYDSQANNFKLLLDKGSLKELNNQFLEDTTKDLLRYFFIGISLPNDSFWVNLRPDSPGNIIDDWLAQTDVGKIMLEADLQLKKDTAKATSPQTPEGKEYWDKLYKKAGEIFGSENITIPTLTRPWIVPGEIIIRETLDSAYIYKATLKVMLEQDYLKDSAVYNFKDDRLKELNEYSSQLIRELIIPKLTKEVNTSKRYATLRQVYYSLILAYWFKARFYGKGGLYSSLINKEDLTNLTSSEPWLKETYFKAYQKSFKDGEYNIQQPVYTPYGQSIRSYFSGGIQIMPKERLQVFGQAKQGSHPITILPAVSSSPAVERADEKMAGITVTISPAVGKIGEIRATTTTEREEPEEAHSSLSAVSRRTFLSTLLLAAFFKSLPTEAATKTIKDLATQTQKLQQFFESHPWEVFIRMTSLSWRAGHSILKFLPLQEGEELLREVKSTGIRDREFRNMIKTLVDYECGKGKIKTREEMQEKWRQFNESYLIPRNFYVSLGGYYDESRGLIQYTPVIYRIKEREAVAINSKNITVVYGRRVQVPVFYENSKGFVLLQHNNVIIDLDAIDKEVESILARIALRNTPISRGGIPYAIGNSLVKEYFGTDAWIDYSETGKAVIAQKFRKRIRAHELMHKHIELRKISPRPTEQFGVPNELWIPMPVQFRAGIAQEIAAYLNELAKAEDTAGVLLELAELLIFGQIDDTHFWAGRFILNTLAGLPVEQWVNDHNPLGTERLFIALLNQPGLKQKTAELLTNTFPGIDLIAYLFLRDQASQSASSPATEPSSRPGGIQDASQNTLSIDSQLGKTGGIDFRSLPIVTQAIGNLSANINAQAINRLSALNLNQELQNIQRMIIAEFRPSSERIKEYIQASCFKENSVQDLDKVILCISDILRQEEESLCSTEPVLKDILVLLESGMSQVELKAIFTGIKS